VIVAAGTHVEVPNELLAQIRVPAGLTLLPRVGGNFEALAPGLTRLLLLAEPGHRRNVTAHRWWGKTSHAISRRRRTRRGASPASATGRERPLSLVLRWIFGGESRPSASSPA
jgi:hypothetical protein